MSRLRFLLIFCFFISQQVHAQTNWFKELKIPNIINGRVTKIIPLGSDELLIIGGGTDTSNQQNRVKLIVAKTTDQLQLISFKSYDSPKHRYVYAFMPTGYVIQNNCIYMTGGLLSSLNQNVSTLLKLNLNGDTLWQRFYTANGNRDVAFEGLCMTNDNKLAVTGFSQDWTNHTSECLLMKLDTLGNELWRKYILNDEPKKMLWCYRIIQDKTSSKFYMAGLKYLGNNSNFTSAGSLVITDSLGNVLRQVTLNNANGGPFYDMIQTKDSNLVACGGWNSFNDLGGETRTKSMVVKLNRNGDTLWSVKSDTPSIYNFSSKLSEYPNGNIFVAGVLDTLQNHNINRITKIRIMSINSNGSVIWKRNIRYARSNDQSMAPLCITNFGSNGFLIGVYYYYKSIQNFNVLKIDTLGCDTVPGFCDYEDLTVDLKEQDAREVSLKVYPNPNQGQFIIECPETTSGSDYLLTDILGRTIQSGAITNGKQAVNVADLPNGIYTLRILSAHNQNFGYKIIIQK